MIRTVSRAAVMALLALTLFAAAPAAAKSPPRGTYTCTTYSPSTGNGFAGTLRILSKNRYTVNGGKKGKFTTKGRKIRFRTGDYKKLWIGKWSRSAGNPVIIYLYFRSDTKLENEALTCSKS